MRHLGVLVLVILNDMITPIHASFDINPMEAVVRADRIAESRAGDSLSLSDWSHYHPLFNHKNDEIEADPARIRHSSDLNADGSQLPNLRVSSIRPTWSNRDLAQKSPMDPIQSYPNMAPQHQLLTRGSTSRVQRVELRGQGSSQGDSSAIAANFMDPSPSSQSPLRDMEFMLVPPQYPAAIIPEPLTHTITQSEPSDALMVARPYFAPAPWPESASPLTELLADRDIHSSLFNMATFKELKACALRGEIPEPEKFLSFVDSLSTFFARKDGNWLFIEESCSTGTFWERVDNFQRSKIKEYRNQRKGFQAFYPSAIFYDWNSRKCRSKAMNEPGYQTWLFLQPNHDQPQTLDLNLSLGVQSPNRGTFARDQLDERIQDVRWRFLGLVRSINSLIVEDSVGYSVSYIVEKQKEAILFYENFWFHFPWISVTSSEKVTFEKGHLKHVDLVARAMVKSMIITAKGVFTRPTTPKYWHEQHTYAWWLTTLYLVEHRTELFRRVRTQKGYIFTKLRDFVDEVVRHTQTLISSEAAIVSHLNNPVLSTQILSHGRPWAGILDTSEKIAEEMRQKSGQSQEALRWDPPGANQGGGVKRHKTTGDRQTPEHNKAFESHDAIFSPDGVSTSALTITNRLVRSSPPSPNVAQSPHQSLDNLSPFTEASFERLRPIVKLKPSWGVELDLMMGIIVENFSRSDSGELYIKESEATQIFWEKVLATYTQRAQQSLADSIRRATQRVGFSSNDSRYVPKGSKLFDGATKRDWLLLKEDSEQLADFQGKIANSLKSQSRDNKIRLCKLLFKTRDRFLAIVRIANSLIVEDPTHGINNEARNRQKKAILFYEDFWIDFPWFEDSFEIQSKTFKHKFGSISDDMFLDLMFDSTLKRIRELLLRPNVKRIEGQHRLCAWVLVAYLLKHRPLLLKSVGHLRFGLNSMFRELLGKMIHLQEMTQFIHLNSIEAAV